MSKHFGNGLMSRVIDALNRNFGSATDIIANRLYRGGFTRTARQGGDAIVGTSQYSARVLAAIKAHDARASAAAEKLKQMIPVSGEVRIRPGAAPEYRATNLRELRSTEMRQMDDIDASQGRERRYRTEPVEMDPAQLRTEPAADLQTVVEQSGRAEEGARLVVGGGHSFRPAEPGEVFLNEDPASKPDVLGKFQDMRALPGDVFDEVYFEGVPLFDGLRNGGAAELHRVLKPDGKLLVVTGPVEYIAEAEQSRNFGALRAAGFQDIEIRAMRIDPSAAEPYWSEFSATKAGSA